MEPNASSCMLCVSWVLMLYAQAHVQLHTKCGLFRKPSLPAQGGPMLRSGENVTLVCSTERASDQFHLLREGENLGRVPRGALQAEFPLGPKTPAHSGDYRCLGSFTHSPYSWSDSRDPLFLSVTGSPTSTCPSTMDPHTTEEAQLPQGHSNQLHLLLRLSIAFIYTSIFLAVLVCHWLPTKCCHHGRSAQGRQNSERRGGSSQPKPLPQPEPLQCPVLQPQRSHFIPSFTSPSSQDPPAEDVIFVHLNHRTLSEGLFTPTPLSPLHLFADTSLYKEFDVNQDHADPDLAPSFEHTECYQLKSYISF